MHVTTRASRTLPVLLGLLLTLAAAQFAPAAASKPAAVLLTYHQEDGDRAVYTASVSNVMKVTPPTGETQKLTTSAQIQSRPISRA